MDADINFYFDPVCPFAWMTSKWVRQVQAQREYTVDWRFISLRLINAEVDYDAHFPPEYEAGHTAGLRLLRVAARARAEHGRASIARLYAAFGAHIFEVAPDQAGTETMLRERRGTREFVEPILAEAGLPLSLADALDDESWDREIQQETNEALALTGKDVGTPIIHFEPPAGVAFFGPVITRLPRDDEAAELWDHVVGLARFPGFAELKRSLREQPQLAAFGIDADTVGVQEDWHGGSRRQKNDRSVSTKMSELNSRSHQESVTVAASAETLYDMVSDITRTGEWSPVCTTCWWDDEATAGQVGAWFTGRNELPHRTWETRSQVEVADGRQFGWVVGGDLVRWGFTLSPADTGTVLSEYWEFLPGGIAMFEEKFGDQARGQITDRTRQAHDGIPKTLAAIKQIAESK